MTKRFDVIYHNEQMLVVDKEADLTDYSFHEEWNQIIDVRKMPKTIPARAYKIKGYRKIIACSSPLEGIPLIKIEEDAENIAERATLELYPDPIKGKDAIIRMNHRMGYYDGYVDGYKAAKTKQYTEEDLRKAYYQGHKSGIGADGWWTFSQTIASLQKRIKSVELEIEVKVVKLQKDVYDNVDVPKLIDNHVIIKEVYYE